MLGAIIGDLAGSVYEYDECFNKSSLKQRLSRLIKPNLIEKDSFYSDDTILTIAILDSIISHIPYETKLREYGLTYYKQKPKTNAHHFKYMFSPGFIKWCRQEKKGNSKGNGALMRISPVAYLYNDLKTILNETRKATIPSHNDEQVIHAAQKISTVIYLARCDIPKLQIRKRVYPNSDLSLSHLQEHNTFDSTYQILEACLCVLFDSSNFEDAIRKAISIGGDTDTIACIVGSMAEAIYGIDKSLKDEALDKLPQNFQNILQSGYQKVKKI